MKNEELKKLTTSMIEPMFMTFKKEIPPMAIIISSSMGPVMMQFETLDSKTQTALGIISVSALLADVVAIIWVSESWGVEITDQKIIKRFGGDGDKIQKWLHHKWPSLEDCPYRTENLLVCVDDGKEQFMANILMKRDQDKNLVWDKLTLDAYSDQPKTDKVSFAVTFNQLLAKGNLLKEMLKVADMVPSEMRPKQERVLEMCLEKLTDSIHWDADTKRIAAKSFLLVKSMKERLKTRQDEPTATRH